MKFNLDDVATHPLQTMAWTDFRREWGNKILETKYGNLTIHNVPFLGKIGVFLRGPRPTQTMLDDLKKVAKKNKLFAIKLEPNIEYEPQIKKLLLKNNCVGGKTFFTPTTFEINLQKSEDDLLMSFSSKTRYNIRYAQRNGIKVEIDNSDQAFDKYIELKRETVARQGFYDHNEKYHRLMWKYLKKARIANLITAKYKGEILTAWILFTWKDSLYYPYGSSTSKNKNLQPNSAIMWGAIKFGIKKKLKYFDLWGREDGKGFTKFKEGFNPRVKNFIGTWDLVIQPNEYMLYVFADLVRWLFLRIKTKFQKPKF